MNRREAMHRMICMAATVLPSRDPFEDKHLRSRNACDDRHRYEGNKISNQAALTLLDEIQGRGVSYFFDRANHSTGLIYDRSRSSGDAVPGNHSASTAASGFGLSVLATAVDHSYLNASEYEARILQILDFFANRCEQVHGFFYHYMEVETGHRVNQNELSSIDTALLVCGALHCRQLLNSRVVDKLVDTIYHRVDWAWMLNHGDTLAMGWTPERGFLPTRWASYCESTLMYLLAIGSPTHRIPTSSWDAIARTQVDYGGLNFVTSYGALFIHQYSHIWCDFRGRRDRYLDYFENSVTATRAHKIFCMQDHGKFPWINESLWGYSASDGPSGYTVWAGPPMMNFPNGTIAPHAAGGSLPFLGTECIAVLRAIRTEYPQCWSRYGFVDAFNPGAAWYDTDVIAIDLGLTVLMADNLRYGSIWKYFMMNKEILNAMTEVGLE